MDVTQQILSQLFEETKFKCTDGDFQKQTEIENDILSLLAAEGFCHILWIKYKKPRALFHLALLIETDKLL